MCARVGLCVRARVCMRAQRIRSDDLEDGADCRLKKGGHATKEGGSRRQVRVKACIKVVTMITSEYARSAKEHSR
eukprot:2828281-Pleurochrysis_carterae.AAC.1